MRKIPLIIDCDPGHDDAIALLIALASDKFDLKGITTVGGNQTVEKTTANALKILELVGRTDVPVVRGRSNPMMSKLRVAEDVHGKSGMDGPVLPEPSAKPLDMNVVEFIAEQVEKSVDPFVLVAVGPFTNIGTFLLAYPHLHKKIEKIHVMGGGVYEGNRTQLAEFNVWNDPEAAKVVTDSKIPVHFFGLDVTHKALIRQDEFHLFREEKGPVFQFVADLLDFYSICYVNERKLEGCPMHDSCAVASLIDPIMFTGHHTFIDVDIEGVKTRGSCIVDLRAKERRMGDDNGVFYMNVDRLKFLRLIIESCHKLEQDMKN
jgi:pyrimidine-specific ribonucleoside hydrolase